MTIPLDLEDPFTSATVLKPLRLDRSIASTHDTSVLVAQNTGGKLYPLGENDCLEGLVRQKTKRGPKEVTVFLNSNASVPASKKAKTASASPLSVVNLSNDDRLAEEVAKIKKATGYIEGGSNPAYSQVQLEDWASSIVSGQHMPGSDVRYSTPPKSLAQFANKASTRGKGTSDPNPFSATGGASQNTLYQQQQLLFQQQMMFLQQFSAQLPQNIASSAPAALPSTPPSPKKERLFKCIRSVREVDDKYHESVEIGKIMVFVKQSSSKPHLALGYLQGLAPSTAKWFNHSDFSEVLPVDLSTPSS